MANVMYTFGWGKSSKLATLFTEHNQTATIEFSDLAPINAINTREIQVAKKDDFRKHIVRVDKAGTNSTVEYNGTNVTVKTNLGVVNLVNGAIHSSSHPDGGSYSHLFSIASNGILVVTMFEQLPVGENRLLIQEL
jgi:hypothetical protein